ncbi:MAG: bifunctional phosphoribosyl-AMP cyclohydrolase/phosphoribosyl-ATP diphosphatase HisIE [Lachnospiraceae bacterium]|nr:bifunctional phosphoribosyl-AMP cyclohydrolase/phosphoribosyl-ATP diphosphatase HisIE [Lachnospiraceae bacterium]
MKDKQIIGCVHTCDDVTAEAMIQMEHLGMDAIYLIDDAQPSDEEKIIKLIKAVNAKADIPIMVKRNFKRLEDVKKIIYAGNTRVVMDAVLDDDYQLMKEAVERFGKANVLAWIPMIQIITENLLQNIKECGVSACVVDSLNSMDIFDEQKMEAYVCLRDSQLDCVQSVLDMSAVSGVIAKKYSSMEMDLMNLKHNLKSSGISMNCFESKMPFDEFKLNNDGLIPVVVQDYKTGKVLMLAYMNKESYEETIRSGRMTYWSRSRQELWKKGDTSGHYQYVKSLDIDCDKDTILAKVAQIGAACHTGNESCFFTNLVSKNYEDVNPMTIFDQVMETILERKEHPKEGSYTNYLFDKGIDKILKKVGEEATEIVIAAKNPDSDELKYEICDFLYHMMVLMAERDVNWKEITKELASRH